MKKHHTDDVAKISWHGGLYAVPIGVMERYKVTPDINSDYVSIDDLFGNLTRKSGEPGELGHGRALHQAQHSND